ncbi:MAG: hypothetical protein EON54_00745 [Alcaligenaceae bacterium]|nr:MAG: hypothetical protein EON54_00745 [Alcaligenaceae bacterium]
MRHDYTGRFPAAGLRETSGFSDQKMQRTSCGPSKVDLAKLFAGVGVECHDVGLAEMATLVNV